MRFQSENGRMGDQRLPERLKQDKERLKKWRGSKRPGERIPERFWQMALSYVGALPLSRVSQEFSLDYVKLKRLAGPQAGWPKQKADPADPVARFLELPWVRFGESGAGETFSAPSGQPGLVLERGDGSRLRIDGLLPEIGYVQALIAVFYPD